MGRKNIPFEDLCAELGHTPNPGRGLELIAEGARLDAEEEAARKERRAASAKISRKPRAGGPRASR